MEKRLKRSSKKSVRKTFKKKSFAQLTAIEIEVIRKNLLTDIIRPEDGTLASIYSENTLSSELVSIFGNADKKAILCVKWDLLPPKLKNFILSDISKTADFHKDRRVPGFVTKDTISINPKESFYFLNILYEAGKLQQLSLSGFLHPLLEYSASTRVTDAYGLEFHFRSTLDFSSFRKEIDTFFSKVIPAISGEQMAIPDGTHQHIPAPLPYSFLSQTTKYGGSTEEAAMSLCLYIQALELAMIVFNSEVGVGLDVVFHEDPKRAPIINFMSKKSLALMYDYFIAVFKG